jgi:hypothetical protein
VNDELKRLWAEAVVAYPMHVPEETKGKQKISQ